VIIRGAHHCLGTRNPPAVVDFIVLYNEPPLFLQANSVGAIEKTMRAARSLFWQDELEFHE
jgi:hypothetical protein